MNKRFLTIFNDKKMLIPANIKQELNIQNGDLILVTVEKVYVSDPTIKDRINKQRVISF